MTAQIPRYSPDEVVQRGETLYTQNIAPHVEAGHRGEYIAIDIETGAYLVGKNYHEAAQQMLTQNPDAALCVLRIGYAAVGRVGGRVTVAHP